MLKYIFMVLLLCVPMATYASDAPAPSYVKKYFKDAAPVGQGRLNYMFFSVYDAVLYAPKGQFDARKKFALSLKYLREIEGRSIADASADQIRKQGFKDELKLAQWHDQMLKIFPDVDSKTVLTGLNVPGVGAKFYKNGKFIGEVRDVAFAKHFFDIWLGSKTVAPDLRRSLLGA